MKNVYKLMVSTLLFFGSQEFVMTMHEVDVNAEHEAAEKKAAEKNTSKENTSKENTALRATEAERQAAIEDTAMRTQIFENADGVKVKKVESILSSDGKSIIGKIITEYDQTTGDMTKQTTLNSNSDMTNEKVFDSNNNKISETDIRYNADHTLSEFTKYNADHNITDFQDFDATGNLKETTNNEYDATGNQTNSTIRDANNDIVEETIYNQDHTIKSITVTAERLATEYGNALKIGNVTPTIGKLTAGKGLTPEQADQVTQQAKTWTKALNDFSPMSAIVEVIGKISDFINSLLGEPTRAQLLDENVKTAKNKVVELEENLIHQQNLKDLSSYDTDRSNHNTAEENYTKISQELVIAKAELKESIENFEKNKQAENGTNDVFKTEETSNTASISSTSSISTESANHRSQIIEKMRESNNPESPTYTESDFVAIQHGTEVINPDNNTTTYSYTDPTGRTIEHTISNETGEILKNSSRSNQTSNSEILNSSHNESTLDDLLYDEPLQPLDENYVFTVTPNAPAAAVAVVSTGPVVTTVPTAVQTSAVINNAPTTSSATNVTSSSATQGAGSGSSGTGNSNRGDAVNDRINSTSGPTSLTSNAGSVFFTGI